MIDNVSIDYPLWFLIFPPLSGLIFAAILYLGNKKSKLKRSTSIFLSIVRFIAISLITALLLKPYVKTLKKHYQKPNIVFAVDNSASMVANADSLVVKERVNSISKEIKQRFGSKYEINSLTFGSKISYENPDFSDSYSNYSELSKFLNKQYKDQKNSLIIILGDGIYNLGNNPLYSLNNNKIISIASGDTIEKPDIQISDINYNPVNYLNDGTPFELIINSNTSKQENFDLKIYRNKKLIEKKSIHLSENENSKYLNFNFNEKKAGKYHYQFELSGTNDTIKQNNYRDIYVSVLDEKNKILLLANSPHPDVSAIKETLLKNKSFELEVLNPNTKNINLNKYSLVIFHQLPSNKYPLNNLLKEVNSLSKNAWFIIGNQTNMPIFRKYFKLSGINSSGITSDIAFARKNNGFNIFNITQTDDFQLKDLPPLETPLLNYGSITSGDIAYYQNINGLKTSFPLLYFFNQNSAKIGMLMGTGIWKWKMFNFKQSNKFDFTDELINKTANYLSLKTNNRQFYIDYKSEYQSPGKISIKAFLYNKSFEFVKGNEISVRVKDENNNSFNYIFTSQENNYSLNLENLDPGKYSFDAMTNYGGNEFNEKGEFVVIKNDFESYNLKANYKLMYDFANKTKGKFYTLNHVDSLYNYIDEINLPNQVHYTSKYNSLNNLWSILALILFLLSLEWFIRRFAGSY